MRIADQCIHALMQMAFDPSGKGVTCLIMVSASAAHKASRSTLHQSNSSSEQIGLGKEAVHKRVNPADLVGEQDKAAYTPAMPLYHAHPALDESREQRTSAPQRMKAYGKSGRVQTR